MFVPMGVCTLVFMIICTKCLGAFDHCRAAEAPVVISYKASSSTEPH